MWRRKWGSMLHPTILYWTPMINLRWAGLRPKRPTLRIGTPKLYSLHNYNSIPVTSWKPSCLHILTQTWSWTESTICLSLPISLITPHIFFHVKEQFMIAFCKNQQPPEQFSSIQLFAYLSQNTMQRRKSLLPVTKALHNNDIVYRWSYPSKLAITRDGNTSVITNLDEWLKLLCAWDILPEQTTKGSLSASKLDTQSAWHVVTHKRKN